MAEIEMNQTVYAVLCWLNDQIAALASSKQDHTIDAIREKTEIVDVLSQLDADLAVVEGIVDDLVNGEEGIQHLIDVSIEALDAEVSDGLTEAGALAEGKHVGVKVVEEDGVLTSVTVVEGDIASEKEFKDFKAALVGGEDGSGNTIAEQNARLPQIEQSIEDLEAASEGALDQFKAEMVGGSYGEGEDATEVARADSEIGKLEQAIADEADRVDGIVDAMDFSDASTGGEFVTVTVTQEDGKITGVVVAEEDIASAAELEALDKALFGEGGSQTVAGAKAGSVVADIMDAIEEAAGAVDVQGSEGDILVEKADDANEFTVSLIATGVTAGSGNYVTVDANGRATAIETKNYLELDDDDKVPAALEYAADVSMDSAAAQTLVTKGYVDQVKADILGGTDLVDTLDTIKEIQDFLDQDPDGLVQKIADNASDISDLNDAVFGKEAGEGAEAVPGLVDRVDALETAEEAAGGYLKLVSADEQSVQSAVNFSEKPTVGTLAEGASAGANAVVLQSEADAIEDKADAAQDAADAAQADVDAVLLAFTTFATENSITVPYDKA